MLAIFRLKINESFPQTLINYSCTKSCKGVEIPIKALMAPDPDSINLLPRHWRGLLLYFRLTLCIFLDVFLFPHKRDEKFSSDSMYNVTRTCKRSTNEKYLGWWKKCLLLWNRSYHIIFLAQPIILPARLRCGANE